MNTKSRFGLIGIAAILLSSATVWAADVTVFESCSNGRGQTLAAEADDQQAVLVRTVVDNFGQATIHYNPGVLPRLTFAARLFLYTNECARHGLGDSGKTISAARARTADCMAMNTLVGGDVVKPDDLPTLQTELSTLTEAEWHLLPGPMRNFDFAACRSKPSGNVLKMPLDTPPSGKQQDWNSCVRVCADKLWTCQKRGGGDTACLDTHRQCRASCNGGPKPAETPAAEKPVN